MIVAASSCLSSAHSAVNVVSEFAFVIVNKDHLMGQTTCVLLCPVSTKRNRG